MLGSREASFGDVAPVGLERLLGLVEEARVALDEPRRQAVLEPEEVVEDEHLPVAARPRRRCRWSGSTDRAVISGATRSGTASSTMAKQPACFERQRVLEEAAGGRARFLPCTL